MRRKRTTYSILFALCMVLLATANPVWGQDLPVRIEVTWVDTSQFPQIEVYVDAFSADGSRHIGLFADMVHFSEDGTERSPAVYDAPRGTSLVFLIDADQTAQSQWDQIREAIEGYAVVLWMDEDLDDVTIIVANGQKSETLVKQTNYQNSVYNAFILETGAYYVPASVPSTPLNDLIGETLSGMAGPTPTPGAYRALVVLSSGDTNGSERSVEGVTALAKDSGIPMFTILVGQNPTGEQTMQQLARNSGGQFYRLESAGSLSPLWELVSSHRQQYAISYRSQIVASGSHAVKVHLSDTVNDSRNFEITVLNPQVEITLPKANHVIQRRPPQPDSDPAGYDPQTQAVKYLWSWPDQHERQVTTVQLRVNGVVQQQLDLTTSSDRNLIWDIANLAAGAYSLRVEVVDNLGLKGESLEVPVTIEMLAPTPASSPTPAITATPGPGMLTSAVNTVKRNMGCFAVSGLSLGVLITMLFASRRRAATLKTSPINFLRRQPFFRPIDRVLVNIERVFGPIRVKKPKISLPDRDKKPAAWMEVIKGQTAVPSPISLEGETSLGRSKERAKIVFAERTVSRLHARIVPEHGGNYRVYNHSSQNTWVNEQRVPEHGLILKDGDEIRMGLVHLRFRTKKR